MAATPPPVAPPHPPVIVTPPVHPPGWTVAVAAGSLALGAAFLHWWPDDSEGRRAAPQLQPSGLIDGVNLTHVVGYLHPTVITALSGEVYSLLNEASYGCRWPGVPLGRAPSATRQFPERLPWPSES